MSRIDRIVPVFLLLVHGVFGQTHSETIADLEVARQKVQLATLMGTEIGLLRQQRELMRSIKIEEDRYQDKIGPRANISNGPVFLAVQGMMLSMSKKIRDIEHNIRLRKYASLGLFHGLYRQESELKRQKGYFQQLQRENRIVTIHALGSGGGGHNYTAYLKLLLRVMKLRTKLLDIDRDVKTHLKVLRFLSK